MARGKYARKRLLTQLRNRPIQDSGLSHRVVKALANAGIYNIADLIICREEKLKAFPGIGEKAIQEILAVKEEIKK